MRVFTLTLTLLAMLVLISGCMMNDPKKQVAENEAKLLKEGIEALEQGSAAPAFSLLIQDGEEVTQAELLDSGGGRLLLFFIPAADTPNTTKNLVELNKHTETIANNGVALALVAPNAPEHLKKYADEFGFSMTMLSDPNGTTAEAYGCFVPGEEEDGEAGEHEHVIFQRTLVLVRDSAEAGEPVVDAFQRMAGGSPQITAFINEEFGEKEEAEQTE